MDNDIIRWVRGAAHRPALLAAAGFVVVSLVCVIGLVVDPRLLGGQPVWAKPLKFSVSFAVYLATFALLVPLARRAPRVVRVASAGLVLATTVEIAAIVLQVVRGRPSHFNVATPFDAGVTAIMGAGSLALWVLTAVVAVVLLRERTLSASLRRGIGLGLLVALAGMSVAFLMVTPTAAQLAAAPTAGLPTIGAHSVGAADGGQALPLLGWSTTAGDLRIGHFVGLHALQALPLLAIALDALAGRVRALGPPAVRTRLVVIGASAWFGLTALLTVQALRGQSIVAPDGPTIAAAAALLLATVGATAVVLVRRGPPRTYSRYHRRAVSDITLARMPSSSRSRNPAMSSSWRCG